MSSTPENSDPYLYPGTSVLKNLRGLTDPEQLERFEARRTHQRIAELIDNPIVGAFDLAHLRAVTFSGVLISWNHHSSKS
jgi:cell filamentation protein